MQWVSSSFAKTKVWTELICILGLSDVLVTFEAVRMRRHKDT